MVIIGVVKTKYESNKFFGRVDFLADEKVETSDIPTEVQHDQTTYQVDTGSTVTTISGDVRIKGEQGWGDWL